MKQFLIDLFNTLGMGINGNVNNINLTKASGYFPNYDFETRTVSDELTCVVIRNNTTGGSFEIVYKTNENGRILDMDIND